MTEIWQGKTDPGFYAAVPLTEYLSLPGASSSRLRLLKAAPAKAREDMLNPPQPTEALLLGDAIHAAVLEPDRFTTEYVVASQCMATKRDGKRCDNPGKHRHPREGWLCGIHAKPHDPLEFITGERIITQDQHDMCMGIRDQALIHSTAARKFLKEFTGATELTGIWQDRETEVLARLRGDRVVDQTATNVELKSTMDAAPYRFSRDIFHHGYYGQQGFYSDGFAQLQRDIQHHVIIAVEKRPPYLVAVYRLVDEVVAAGKEEMRSLLRVWAECQERDEWPGYPDEVVDISLPSWAWDQLYSTTTPAEAVGGLEMIR